MDWIVVLIIGCYVAIIAANAAMYRSFTKLSNHINSTLDKMSRDLSEFRLEFSNAIVVIQEQIKQIQKSMEE